MELILTSLLAFISTNIDDIFVILLFFSNSQYLPKQVVIGQYLGIILLIVISLAGSFVGHLLPVAYIGLLGFIPIWMGIKALMAIVRTRSLSQEKEIKIPTEANHRGNILSIAAVTFANGGDNIGIYIPLFSTLNAGGKIIMVSIFLVMVGAWCVLAGFLSKHPVIAKMLGKYGNILTPIILILLGIYILYESNSYSLIGRILSFRQPK